MADAKRGKMHASASQLALVLLLIGWKGGANLLSQSHRVESAKPMTFRHSNENRSKRYLKYSVLTCYHRVCSFGMSRIRISDLRSLGFDSDSTHGTSSELIYLFPGWICWFLWCAMIQMISEHWSWSGSSQWNALIIIIIIIIIFIIIPLFNN